MGSLLADPLSLLELLHRDQPFVLPGKQPIVGVSLPPVLAEKYIRSATVPQACAIALLCGTIPASRP